MCRAHCWLSVSTDRTDDRLEGRKESEDVAAKPAGSAAWTTNPSLNLKPGEPVVTLRGTRKVPPNNKSDGAKKKGKRHWVKEKRGSQEESRAVEEEIK